MMARRQVAGPLHFGVAATLELVRQYQGLMAGQPAVPHAEPRRM
jgi:hypothetical protein